MIQRYAETIYESTVILLASKDREKHIESIRKIEHAALLASGGMLIPSSEMYLRLETSGVPAFFRQTERYMGHLLLKQTQKTDWTEAEEENFELIIEHSQIIAEDLNSLQTLYFQG